MNLPLREGISLNLSFLHFSDVLVILLVLILSFFNLLPSLKIKQKWLQAVVYTLLILVIGAVARLVFQTAPLGVLNIRWYGVLIMVGALAGAWLATIEAKRRGQNPDEVWEILPWVLVAGIIGARLWHILLPPASHIAAGLTTHYYFTHPLDAIAIWRGGVGIPGAVIGGLVALLIYCRVKHLNFGQWTDIIAPGLALAQAIGRWGNFLNQEIYGAPTNLPWAIKIDPQFRLPQLANQETYHPLFAYESLWNLANMTLLLWLGRKHQDKLLNGDLFLIYVLFYSFGRFWLEFLRLDPAPVAGINFNQSFMGLLFLGCGITLIVRHVVNNRKGQPN
jgi:phosphatidylglycerol:prolipoprotein diacylglycerol transferase